MNICFFEVEPWETSYLKQKLKGHTLSFFDQPLTERNASKAKNADILSVFIYSRVSRLVLEQLPKLKLIATRSTGYDHIDHEACKQKNIGLATVPTYGENTVAEHTFALILNLTRKIHLAWDRTRHLDFSIDGLRGVDLRGKTLAVIGVGHIGQHVIRMANGFEMNVIAVEHKPNRQLEKKLGYRHVTLNTALKKADILSLHCPYNKNTHHLINKKNIKLMKKTAFIINTSRGGLIETEALVHALDKQIIAGAGLDVVEEECAVREDAQVMSKHAPKHCDLRIVLENHILAKKDNVIITPHNAFNSVEALHRILDTTIQNIKKFSQKKKLNRII